MESLGMGRIYNSGPCDCPCAHPPTKPATGATSRRHGETIGLRTTSGNRAECEERGCRERGRSIHSPGSNISCAHSRGGSAHDCPIGLSFPYRERFRAVGSKRQSNCVPSQWIHCQPESYSAAGGCTSFHSHAANTIGATRTSH